MNLFQIILLGASAYLAYKIYEHIQTLQEPANTPASTPPARVDRNAEELIAEADVAFENDDLSKAKSLLAEADVKDPNNAQTLGKIAYILAHEGESARAIEHYEHSLSIEEDDMVHNALASLYRDKEEYEKAQEHYKKALAIDADYDVTYYNYGNLLQDMEKTDEAKEMYEKALSLNPDFTQAREELERLS